MFGLTEKGRGGDENWAENNSHLFGSQMKKRLNQNGTENMVDPTSKNFLSTKDINYILPKLSLKNFFLLLCIRAKFTSAKAMGPALNVIDLPCYVFF